MRTKRYTGEIDCEEYLQHPGPLLLLMCWVPVENRRSHNLTGNHYNDVIIRAMASQITSVTIVYSTVCSCADQRKHQRPASLAFVGGIHRSPVNSPHKRPVTRELFPFDDVIMLRHNGEPIVCRNYSLQGCLHLALMYRSHLIITSIKTCGIKLLNHFQTSTAWTLKFIGNE